MPLPEGKFSLLFAARDLIQPMGSVRPFPESMNVKAQRALEFVRAYGFTGNDRAENF